MAFLTNKVIRLVLYTIMLSSFITYTYFYVKYGGIAVAVVLHTQREDGHVGERVAKGDFSPSFSERWCEQAHGHTSIPNKVHFIQITWDSSPTELTFDAYLAIKAVILRVKPDDILIHHYNFDTSNEWYLKIKDHVTLVQHSLNDAVGPQRLNISDFLVQHQADVLRLHAVHQDGGIYLDSDVYAFKSFDQILATSKDAVMGNEGANRYGLCNGVIIGRQGSRFLERWLDSYQTFTDTAWNYHSVRLPKILAAKYPSEVCTLSPAAFFWPTWETYDVEWMHKPLSPEEALEVQQTLDKNGGALHKNQYAYHAWGPGKRAYVSKLTPEKIINEDTRFNLMVRPIVNADL